MLRGHITCGRLFGIELRVHFSWFFIAALLTMSLVSRLYQVNGEWSAVLIWTSATVTALAFFAAILLHELSHAAVARSRGVEIRAITLFALGGVAHMKRDAADARTEFWMGLAGPIASAAIGGLALGFADLAGWQRDATPATPGLVMLVWFGYINLSIAMFNLIPGFPLDGGRILRAILWWRSGNLIRATRVAATLGQVVAAVFIGVGFLSFLSGSGLGGLWLAIIGLFLMDSARAAAFDIAVREDFRGLRVADIMSRDCATIGRGASVSEIAEQMLRTAKRCFFVVDEDRVAGLITPQELRAVPHDRWASTPAGQAMKPVERLHHVTAEAPASVALDAMAQEDVNQLPVLDHGRILGVVSRDQMLRLIALRTELAM